MVREVSGEEKLSVLRRKGEGREEMRTRTRRRRRNSCGRAGRRTDGRADQPKVVQEVLADLKSLKLLLTHSYRLV